jgi:hypothetical protein
MAVVYPGADYRQLPNKSRTLLTPTVINIHTMVGTMAGTEAWFSPSGRPYSHFGVGGNGAVWQWQDLRYRAASDLNGNPFCISIETEDKGSSFPNWSGSNVPHFTTAQLNALVQLVGWLCTKFNIRRVLLTSSCQRNGVSYHRLGIDPYRQAGCTKYSNATGKVCPGDNKISDIKNKLMPALQGGGSTEDDWMALFNSKAELEDSVANGVKKALAVSLGVPGPAVPQFVARVAEGVEKSLAIDMGVEGAAVDQIRSRVQEAVNNVITWEASVGSGPLHDIVRQVIEEGNQ